MGCQNQQRSRITAKMLGCDVFIAVKCSCKCHFPLFVCCSLSVIIQNLTTRRRGVYTMDDAEPSHISPYLQNTNPCQGKPIAVVRQLPMKHGIIGQILRDLWPGPHFILVFACVTDLPSVLMTEQWAKNWTQTQSFLRSEE